MGPNTHTAEWSLADDDLATMGPATTHEIENGAADVLLDDPDHPPEMAPSKALEDTHGGKTDYRQVKPNKVYIGGLPDHTRAEDLQNCFGKIGDIAAIELKLGYGFVEFDTKEAAQDSVARYHEGYFMGNKIRVELSHSRGRTFKRLEDPGACYACGEAGHWARECPRSTTTSRGGPTDQPSRDRDYSSRDYHHQSRDTHSHRDEYSKHSSSRDTRYYNTPAAAPASTRDHRRALTPSRDRRDDPPQRREYNDHRTRSSPPPAPPVARYERSGHHTAERDYSTSGAPTHRNAYDRHDRRHANTDDRNVPYSSHGRRPRTPPGPPPPGPPPARDDPDKAPRGHYQTQETQKRPTTPPPPYPGSNANGSRRRRSLSPPPRYDSRYGGPSHADGDRYPTAAPREGTRVRDYHHRSGRGEDSSHRRS